MGGGVEVVRGIVAHICRLVHGRVETRRMVIAGLLHVALCHAVVRLWVVALLLIIVHRRLLHHLWWWVVVLVHGAGVRADAAS